MLWSLGKNPKEEKSAEKFHKENHIEFPLLSVLSGEYSLHACGEAGRAGKDVKQNSPRLHRGIRLQVWPLFPPASFCPLPQTKRAVQTEPWELGRPAAAAAIWISAWKSNGFREKPTLHGMAVSQVFLCNLRCSFNQTCISLAMCSLCGGAAEEF